VLSLTAVSARPTSTVLGADENETSTSTSTGVASMPMSVYEASFASMERPCAARERDRQERHGTVATPEKSACRSTRVYHARRGSSSLGPKTIGAVLYACSVPKQNGNNSQ
jgi:hypothetical protein